MTVSQFVITLTAFRNEFAADSSDVSYTFGILRDVVYGFWFGCLWWMLCVWLYRPQFVDFRRPPHVCQAFKHNSSATIWKKVVGSGSGVRRGLNDNGEVTFQQHMSDVLVEDASIIYGF